MDTFKILYSSFFSFLVLLLLTRLMGRKQISQLSLFDYVTGISIGSIAAEMATDLDQNFWHPILAMTLYAGLDLLLNLVSSRSLKAELFLHGRPVVLFDAGRLYPRRLKTAKLCVSDLLMEARTQGYFSLSEIQTAVLETNGSLSFLPKSDTKPASTGDLNLTVTQQTLQTDVMYGGRILSRNLRAIGYDEAWLREELRRQGLRGREDEIMLATADQNGELCAFLTGEEKK